MQLTEKEKSILSDLIKQEMVCAEKYAEYASRAGTPQLQKLFADIGETEQKHFDTLNGILSGRKTSSQRQKPAPMQPEAAPVQCCAQNARGDAYLCEDALSMEKHVASVYSTSVFEFSNEKLRRTLNEIEGEEQHHGKQLYDYMSRKGMY